MVHISKNTPPSKNRLAVEANSYNQSETISLKPLYYIELTGCQGSPEAAGRQMRRFGAPSEVSV